MFIELYAFHSKYKWQLCIILIPQPLSEISETASDAWSTDVLAASDTDEKHSELLKDLELDLNSVIGDREEGDSSVGQDDGEAMLTWSLLIVIDCRLQYIAFRLNDNNQ